MKIVVPTTKSLFLADVLNVAGPLTSPALMVVPLKVAIPVFVSLTSRVPVETVIVIHAAL